jgi:PAS domain S-box-containing protein
MMVSELELCFGMTIARLSGFTDTGRARLPRAGEDDVLHEAANSGRDGGKIDHRLTALTRVATAWRSFLRFRSAIGWRLLVRVLLFSSVITLLLTLTQLYLDYRRDVGAVDQRMSEIDGGYRQSLGEGLWRLDVRQLQLQVEGILRLPDISYVELREATDKAAPLVVTAGSHQSSPAVRREFRIFYTTHGADQLVGILVVEATFDRIYRRLLNTTAIIMVGQAIKTFLVSFFILFIVHRLITRHLTAIATSLRSYDLRGARAPLRLDRRPPRPADEFDDLVEAFNHAYARLEAAYGDLQEREAKIRRLVDSNIVGIFTYDLDRHILEANDAFLAMVGYSRDDVISGRLNFARLTPPEWAEDDQRRLAALTSTGTWQPSEKEFFRKDGSRVPVLLGSAIFSELQRQGIGFVVDLSDRKRAEDAERRYHEVHMELAHANRVATLGQLSASIAHEINQPLTGILTNASTELRMLAADPPNIEGARETARRTIRDGKRAHEIIKRLRALFGKKDLTIEAVDLNEATREVVALSKSEFQRDRVLWQLELADDLPLVRCDRVQFQQVILNLLRNAMDSMRAVDDRPKQLIIKTAISELGHVTLAVQDSGPGVDPASLERIFDAFYTTKSGGLGMGLSVCRAIVEAHKGRLWATTGTPHGATFQLTLPVSADNGSVRNLLAVPGSKAS